MHVRFMSVAGALLLLAGCTEPSSPQAGADNQVSSNFERDTGSIEQNVRTAEREVTTNCTESNGDQRSTSEDPCLSGAVSDRAEALSAEAEEDRSQDELDKEAEIVRAGVVRSIRYEVAAQRLDGIGYRPLPRERRENCANSGARSGRNETACSANANFSGCVYPLQGSPEPLCWFRFGRGEYAVRLTTNDPLGGTVTDIEVGTTY